MRKGHPILAALLTAAIAGCESSRPVPSSPSPVTEGTSAQPPAAAGPCVVGFDDLRGHGAAFTTHSSCGLAISASAASWQASTTYGRPAPFVQFMSPGGVTTTGEITFASVDGPFTFVSVDIYSSTTKIPYEITGTLNGAPALSLQNVQNNTFGNFATIINAAGLVPIDKLRIRLTNPAAPCCTNP